MTSDTQDGRQRVRAIIQESGVGMLTTVDEDGRFVSRPMLPLLLDDDPRIYFLTHSSSEKTGQVGAQSQVAMTFVGSDAAYLAIVGRATTSRDQELIARLWKPTYRAWFPDGAADADLTVLRVEMDRADYWEAPTSRVARLIEAVTAIVTHTPYETPKTTVEKP